MDADDELVPDLEDSRGLLEQLHARTGWEYGITITASTHVAWNTEVRVTPAPYTEGAPDRSYATLRVGPPDWALEEAIRDVLLWLDEAGPGPAPEPCFACGDDPDGYPGPERKP